MESISLVERCDALCLISLVVFTTLLITHHNHQFVDMEKNNVEMVYEKVGSEIQDNITMSIVV